MISIILMVSFLNPAVFCYAALEIRGVLISLLVIPIPLQGMAPLLNFVFSLICQ